MPKYLEVKLTQDLSSGFGLGLTIKSHYTMLTQHLADLERMWNRKHSSTSYSSPYP